MTPPLIADDTLDTSSTLLQPETNRPTIDPLSDTVTADQLSETVKYPLTVAEKIRLARTLDGREPTVRRASGPTVPDQPSQTDATDVAHAAAATELDSKELNGNESLASVPQEADAPADPKEHIRKLWAQGLDFPVIIWMTTIHLGALAAFFTFSWQGLATFLVLYWMCGSVGVCMGFHRLLTHGGFSTYKPVRWLLAFIGGMAGEGSALLWCAVHRKHHQYSDLPGDPHSPHDGAWWSHILWLAPKLSKEEKNDLVRRYVPDLNADPVLRFLDKTFALWHFLLLGVLLTAGWAIWDLKTGISMVVYGSFLRMVVVLHATWLVNSATHMWGYRNYKTTDDSRNLWWVALLSFGEGWHNNHHAYQRIARHGQRWWEFDITWLEIRAMEKLGLVWNVIRSTPAQERALQAKIAEERQAKVPA